MLYDVTIETTLEKFDYQFGGWGTSLMNESRVDELVLFWSQGPIRGTASYMFTYCNLSVDTSAQFSVSVNAIEYQVGQVDLRVIGDHTGSTYIAGRLTDFWEMLKVYLRRYKIVPEQMAPTVPDEAVPWVSESWYLALTIEERWRYDNLRAYKVQWEAGTINDRELAERFAKEKDTIARWRRDLRRRGAPEMDWKKR